MYNEWLVKNFKHYSEEWRQYIARFRSSAGTPPFYSFTKYWNKRGRYVCKSELNTNLFCNTVIFFVTGLTAEAIIKAHRSPPHNLVAGTLPGYPGLPSQLPPQPYIPPPGSASIHYPQFQNKSSTPQYSSFTMPSQSTAQPTVYSAAASAQQTSSTVNKQTQQQFLVPQVSSQAPPGSNPYPPQFVPPPPPPPPPLPPPPLPLSPPSLVPSSSASLSVAGTTISKLPSSAASPLPHSASSNQIYSSAVPGQSQKFFSHSTPKS